MEALAEGVVREAGKPINSARGEVDLTVDRFRRAAAEVRDRTGEYREGSTEGHEGWRALGKHEPIGTALCIGPYNYPLKTVAYQVAPALATGNSVPIKPSSMTPVSAGCLVGQQHRRQDEGVPIEVVGVPGSVGDLSSARAQGVEVLLVLSPKRTPDVRELALVSFEEVQVGWIRPAHQSATTRPGSTVSTGSGARRAPNSFDRSRGSRTDIVRTGVLVSRPREQTQYLPLLNRNCLSVAPWAILPVRLQIVNYRVA